MKPNLDTLKTEIEHYVEDSGLAVFYGYSRALESTPAVYWDCDQYPDFKRFIQAARTAGARVLVFHQRTFMSEQVDDALEELTACTLAREEYREFEQRLTKLRAYDGFVCAIELSFDHEGRVFLFDLRTDWYDELTEILDEIQVLTADTDDDPTMGGYFSKN
jgi:hypothetical protein